MKTERPPSISQDEEKLNLNQHANNELRLAILKKWASIFVIIVSLGSLVFIGIVLNSSFGSPTLEFNKNGLTYVYSPRWIGWIHDDNQNWLFIVIPFWIFVYSAAVWLPNAIRAGKSWDSRKEIFRVALTSGDRFVGDGQQHTLHCVDICTFQEGHNVKVKDMVWFHSMPQALKKGFQPCELLAYLINDREKDNSKYERTPKSTKNNTL